MTLEYNRENELHVSVGANVTQTQTQNVIPYIRN